MKRKSKTIAAWLAFLTGTFGGHRFYLYGWDDVWAWLLPIPSALGWYGISRVLDYGQDDVMSWWLIPLLGFTFAGCSLTAIMYGLTTREAWNARWGEDESDDKGETSWATIGAIVLSLLVGTTVLMSSLVYSFQRYFEYQNAQARKISQ